MTDSTRTPREATTRAKTQRRKPWAPPSKLEAPKAPDGYQHRWIRTSLRGEDDNILRWLVSIQLSMMVSMQV